MRITVVASLVIAVGFAAGCGGGNDTASRQPSGAMTVASPVSAERFVLVGGGHFSVCVQPLEEGRSLEDARATAEARFNSVAEEGRWPAGWHTPAVDGGCPLPAVALTETDRPFLERRACTEQTSGYLVHLYVGSASRFEERFGTSPLRVTPQEYIGTAKAPCFGWVSLAWYVTPDELDEGILADYVVNSMEEVHH